MRRIAVLVIAVIGLQVAPAYAAAGDPVTGYWARTRLGPPVPIEAPTPVPEGGTWVASDPSGPVAVSALRLPIDDGAMPTQLTLEIDRVQGTPAVRVCPAVARWQPEQGGRIDNAPAHDCVVMLKTEVQDAKLVATLPAGFAIGALDIVLAPDPGSVFSVTFKRATAAAVTLQSTETPTAAQPPPAFAPPPGVEPSQSFTAPLAPAVVPPLAPLPGLVPAPAPAGPQVPTPAFNAAPAPAAPVAAAPAALGRLRDDRREAIPAAILFVLIAALALRLQMQPARPPQRLGGGLRATLSPDLPAAAALRGVGRFRGVRTGKPVRL